MMPKKILIADDEPDIVDSLRYILEDEGYIVIPTVNPKNISTLLQYMPHLVIIDIYMSGYDGRIVVRDLRNQETTHDIPVIMMSANHDIADTVYEYGADDFVEKPYDLYALLEKIQFHLNRQR